MDTAYYVLISLLQTAIAIAALWGANLVYRELAAGQGWKLSPIARLVFVLAIGGAAASLLNMVAYDLLGVLRTTSGAVKVVDLLSAVVVIGFVAWLYLRARANMD